MTIPAQAKPPVHLLVREEDVLGGTQLVAACGVRGLDTRLFRKDMAPVTCAACIVRVRGGVQAVRGANNV